MPMIRQVLIGRPDGADDDDWERQLYLTRREIEHRALARELSLYLCSLSCRTLVYKAAWLKDEGRPFAKEAAMAKLYTGELSHRVVNQALQIHGGYGFMDESAISRLYRDQKILEIGEGTNEVQRMVIARHLGLN